MKEDAASRADRMDFHVKDTTVCILAGGRGVRIGGRKCFKTLMGKRLIDHATDIAGEIRDHVQVGKVVVSCGVDDLSLSGFDTLRDRDGEGPISGLHACLLTYGRALIFPCDMPFLTPEFLSYLLERAEGCDITVCSLSGFVQPQVGVYSPRCLSRAEELIQAGTYSLFRLIRDSDLHVQIIEEGEFEQFGEPGRIFHDINTREELEEAEQRA